MSFFFPETSITKRHLMIKVNRSRDFVLLETKNSETVRQVEKERTRESEREWGR